VICVELPTITGPEGFNIRADTQMIQEATFYNEKEEQA
jgi:hypothetical protein